MTDRCDIESAGRGFLPYRCRCAPVELPWHGSLPAPPPGLRSPVFGVWGGMIADWWSGWFGSFGAWVVVLGQKRPPSCRRCAEHPEVLGRRARDGHLLGAALEGKRRTPR